MQPLIHRPIKFRASIPAGVKGYRIEQGNRTEEQLPIYGSEVLKRYRGQTSLLVNEVDKHFLYYGGCYYSTIDTACQFFARPSQKSKIFTDALGTTQLLSVKTPILETSYEISPGFTANYELFRLSLPTML